MATMNISLPDEMKAWVERQVATGRYGNASDYMRDLVRRDQAMVGELQGIIDEAIAGGVVDVSPAELFEDIKRQSRERLVAVADEIRAERDKTDDAA